VIQALQNFAFKPGTQYTCAETFLTPWHFIRTLPEFTHLSSPRIPSTGFSASQLLDIFGNIDYLFHLIFRDFNDFALCGNGHSSYSRFSPLSGHLLHLASPWKNRTFQEHWDKILSNEARLSYTQAALIACSDLFALYDRWQNPKHEANLIFHPARCGQVTSLVLLSPTVDTVGIRMKQALHEWRSHLSVFSLHQLQSEVPMTGLFLKSTPSNFAPSKSSQSSEKRRSTSQSNPFSATPSPTSTSNQQSQRSTQRSSGHQPSRQGESPRSGTRARGPIMTAKNSDFPKSLGEHIFEINKDRPANDKVMIPKFRDGGNPRQLMMCFRFACSNGTGCMMGKQCRYAHLDLSETTRVVSNIPRTFFLEMMKILEMPEVRSHFTPTQGFKNFLG
jgi:hypothetical protein